MNKRVDTFSWDCTYLSEKYRLKVEICLQLAFKCYYRALSNPSIFSRPHHLGSQTGGHQNTATSTSDIGKKRTSVTGLSGEHISEHPHEKIGENGQHVIDGLEDDESVTEDTDEAEVGVFQSSFKCNKCNISN